MRADAGINGSYPVYSQQSAYIYRFFSKYASPRSSIFVEPGKKSCDLLLASICVFGSIITGMV